MYDSLFQALAQAKAQPSHGFRAFESAAQIPGDALSGYMEGRQAKMQMQQPEAMARMLNSTPQGHEMIETMGPQAATSAMYGMQPKDLMDYMGKSAQLQQQGNLGWGNINERNTASQRMADAAALLDAKGVRVAGYAAKKTTKRHLYGHTWAMYIANRTSPDQLAMAAPGWRS